MRTYVRAALLAAAWFLLSATAALAQQEVQVPLDQEGRIDVVDARLAERLGLFHDRFPGFQEARLFLQIPDSTYILEVTTVEADRRLRTRLPLTDHEVEELRGEVTLGVREQAPSAGLDREGRPGLLGGSALLGLGFYGWAVPVILDVDDTATRTGLYMLTAGSSFFGPWLATRNRAVSRGTADLAVYGATRGILHGVLTHLVVTGGDDGSNGSPDNDIRGELATAMALSLAEGFGGLAWAQGRALDLGATRTIGMTGDFGTLQGLALAGLTDPGDRGAAGLVLAGAAAGTALGPTLVRRRDYSPGDVTVVSVGGYLGAYTGLALADLAGPNTDSEERWYAAGAMAGSLAGLVTGDRLVRPHRFSQGQGRLLTLGTVAGGAVGLGIAHLIVGNESAGDDSKIYLASSALGALAAYGLTFRSLAPDADRRPERRSGLEIHLNPVGAASALVGSTTAGERRMPMPVLSGSYRF